MLKYRINNTFSLSVDSATGELIIEFEHTVSSLDMVQAKKLVKLLSAELAVVEERMSNENSFWGRLSNKLV